MQIYKQTNKTVANVVTVTKIHVVTVEKKRKRNSYAGIGSHWQTNTQKTYQHTQLFSVLSFLSFIYLFVPVICMFLITRYHLYFYLFIYLLVSLFICVIMLAAKLYSPPLKHRRKFIG